MPTAGKIEGSCDTAFRRVREVFGDNFDAFGERGASVSIAIEGRTVVDLWGGTRDAEGQLPWEGGTIANVFSTSKGVAALCVLRLVESGQVEIEAPMSRYWPEFAAAGKGDVTVGQCFSHRAGVPALRPTFPPEVLYDWRAMGAALAAEEPWWEPGSAHGYHAITYGWFASELVYRLTGKTLGRYLRDEIAEPLKLDLWIGTPAEQDRRVADLVPAPPDPSIPNRLAEEMQERPDSVTALALNNPPLPFGGFSSRDWRAAEIPAANGHTHARALAQLYGGLAHNGRIGDFPLLARDILDLACEERSAGPDAVLWGDPTRFGFGFMLNQEARRFGFGPSESAFGHPGMGGSLAFGDPEAQIGFGYVMNLLRGELLIDERSSRLIDAVYESL
jgi:CubicO group peptidase (beta-lactamase class C family)